MHLSMFNYLARVCCKLISEIAEEVYPGLGFNEIELPHYSCSTYKFIQQNVGL